MSVWKNNKKYFVLYRFNQNFWYFGVLFCLLGTSCDRQRTTIQDKDLLLTSPTLYQPDPSNIPDGTLFPENDNSISDPGNIGRTETLIPTDNSTHLSVPTRQIVLTTTADDSSGGISVQEDSLIPPIPPQEVVVALSQGCLEMRWRGTGSDIIVLYKIYRRQKITESWNLIATIPKEGDNRGNYTYCDKTVEGQLSLYEYAISAQDHYGNESNFSEPESIK